MNALCEIKSKFVNSGVAAEMVYRTLREAILTGVLGPGTRIKESDISEQLGVSRTPVREAIGRLRAEGLIQSLPTVGTVVSDFSSEHVLATYVPRAVLEGAAARLCATSATDAEIASLERTLEVMEEPETMGSLDNLSDANFAFHELIVMFSRNDYLRQLLQQIWAIVKMCRVSSLMYPGRVQEAMAEHRRILDAIKRRDSRQAEEAARAHIEKAHETRLRMVTDSRRSVGQPLSWGE
ncbi:MAG TPA: GntR family transcriptional regulator [Clostridia bacterium]|nr:GntR family transcriptional regulator [Clostridia bacterium]